MTLGKPNTSRPLKWTLSWQTEAGGIEDCPCTNIHITYHKYACTSISASAAEATYRLLFRILEPLLLSQGYVRYFKSRHLGTDLVLMPLSQSSVPLSTVWQCGIRVGVWSHILASSIVCMRSPGLLWKRDAMLQPAPLKGPQESWHGGSAERQRERPGMWAQSAQIECQSCDQH